MNANRIRVGIVLGAVASLFLFSGPLFAAQTLVAKVGSVPVTRFELQVQIEKILPLEGSFHRGVSKKKMAEIREKALQKVIDQARMVQYAADHHITLDKGRLSAQYQKVRGRFASEKAFEKALGKITPAEYRAMLSRELLAGKTLREMVDDKVHVPAAEVRAYYEKHKAGYMRPRQYKASIIFVKVDPAASAAEKAKLKKKAEDLDRRAKAGEDFYNLAYYNSDDRTRFVGGNLGYFHAGQTIKPFDEALSKMKPGDISGPIRTIYGYYIIKLMKTSPRRQLQFKEVKDQISQAKAKKMRRAIYTAWLAKLRKLYPAQRYEK